MRRVADQLGELAAQHASEHLAPAQQHHEDRAGRAGRAGHPYPLCERDLGARELGVVNDLVDEVVEELWPGSCELRSVEIEVIVQIAEEIDEAQPS